MKAHHQCLCSQNLASVPQQFVSFSSDYHPEFVTSEKCQPQNDQPASCDLCKSLVSKQTCYTRVDKLVNFIYCYKCVRQKYDESQNNDENMFNLNNLIRVSKTEIIDYLNQQEITCMQNQKRKEETASDDKCKKKVMYKPKQQQKCAACQMVVKINGTDIGDGCIICQYCMQDSIEYSQHKSNNNQQKDCYNCGIQSQEFTEISKGFNLCDKCYQNQYKLINKSSIGRKEDRIIEDRSREDNNQEDNNRESINKEYKRNNPQSSPQTKLMSEDQQTSYRQQDCLQNQQLVLPIIDDEDLVACCSCSLEIQIKYSLWNQGPQPQNIQEQSDMPVYCRNCYRNNLMPETLEIRQERQKKKSKIKYILKEEAEKLRLQQMKINKDSERVEQVNLVKSNHSPKEEPERNNECKPGQIEI